MSFSPWDLPIPYGSNHSNLQCCLDCITPSVPTRMLPSKKCVQTSNAFSQFNERDIVEGFALSDLWHSCNEWSAYGVGVPILLNNGDRVVQYYSPSLSALQIYTSKPFPSSKSLFDQTDEKFGELQKEAKLEKHSAHNDNMPSSNSSCLSLDITWDDSTTFQFSSGHTTTQCHYLYCQYNETCSPYFRVPFKEKINELAETYPSLLEFCSTDLSPCSWVAIAWYPLYQIPMTINVTELSACFLTYHALSSLSQEKEKLQDMMGCLGEDIRNSKKGEISLPPFAMVAYKMSGALWINPGTSDQDSITCKQTAARHWLKQLQFQHHDFNFFMSHQF